MRFFGSKAIVSGNPVRQEFFARPPAGDVSGAVVGPESATRAALRVLVFGGSQGAHALNMVMLEAASRLAQGTPPIQVTHQTGERDLAAVRDGYRRAGLEARVEPFLYQMDREMQASDLVVCRAGATTLAELTASGKPSILVPLPTATDDHQRRNALALVKQDAAVMVEERELSGDRIAVEIQGLARDNVRRGQIGDAARQLSRPDAARVIAEKVLSLAR